jgi:hypothetical protein
MIEIECAVMTGSPPCSADDQEADIERINYSE